MLGHCRVEYVRASRRPTTMCASVPLTPNGEKAMDEEIGRIYAELVGITNTAYSSVPRPRPKSQGPVHAEPKVP
eukprot:scaffold678758_cov59-Prasinocladus_malaysianus.AAC.1